MLRKLVLAALLALGFAAAVPSGGVSAAPIGPGLALPSEAAPGVVEKAYWVWRRPYYRRRFYRPRYYYRRRFYRPRYYYRPRFYRRRFWYF